MILFVFYNLKVLLNKYNCWDPAMMGKWGGSGNFGLLIHLCISIIFVCISNSIFIQRFLLFSFVSSSQVRIYLLVNSYIRKHFTVLFLPYLTLFFTLPNDLEAKIRKLLSLNAVGMFQALIWIKVSIERTLFNTRLPAGT